MRARRPIPHRRAGRTERLASDDHGQVAKRRGWRRALLAWAHSIPLAWRASSPNGWSGALKEGLKSSQEQNPYGDVYGRDGSEADIEEHEHWALNHLRHDCL